MTFDESYRWLQLHGLDIGALAKQGDKLAAHTVLAYQEWHADKLNVEKQNTLLRMVNEMATATLTETELKEYQNRYGYKLNEKAH
jgi:hypothetical protein